MNPAKTLNIHPSATGITSVRFCMPHRNIPSIAFVLPAAAIALALPPCAAAQSMENLWKNNCINCHAENGKGGGAGTRTLLTDDLFLQKHDRPFFDAIKNGVAHKGMEAFGETLKDQEIWGLVNYIRELQARERRDRVGSISRKLENGVCNTQRASFKIETAAEKGLDVPWSVEFVPFAGKSGPAETLMIVTNRPGPLQVFDLAGKSLGKVEGTPKVRNVGQGGMMDITIHPDYAKGNGNDWVYLAYADQFNGSDSKGITKVVRGKIKRDTSGAGKFTWKDQQTIFEAKPEHYYDGDVHFGSKIVFDPKDSNTLFFGIGERGRDTQAQDRKRPNGKIHRVHADGSIPKDNPFVDQKDEYPSIWSFGHRNPQGLIFDLVGNLWDTEHGPRGGDEFNVILKARNYGWPVVSFGINYSGGAFKQPWPELAGQDAIARNIVMPLDRWLPSIGACGLDVVRSDKFADWKGDMLAGGLSGNNVDRIRVAPATDMPADAPADLRLKVIEREEIVHGLGRVRDVVSAPDGFIYIVLNDPDKVVRLVPVPR